MIVTGAGRCASLLYLSCLNKGFHSAAHFCQGNVANKCRTTLLNAADPYGTMNSESNLSTSNTFERIKRINERGGEFWSARELARVLDYNDFRNFVGVINKARKACTNSSRTVA